MRALREKEGLLRRLADLAGDDDGPGAADHLAEADDLARTVEVFRRVMATAPSAFDLG